MAIAMACACALPSSPLAPYADRDFKGVGGTRFIAGWWLLVVKFFSTLFVGTYLGFNGLYLA